MTSHCNRYFHSFGYSKLLRFCLTLYLVITAVIFVIFRMHYELTTSETPEQSSTFKSTCSASADARGPHQNVIGYSIYGTNFSEANFTRKYLKPFTDTLRTIPIRYPGWIVRIYHNLRIDDLKNWKELINILDLGDDSNMGQIDLCNVTEIIRNRKLGDLFEMTWRWLPLLDEMVDTLLSRDSDSPIFQREEDAVREWLASDKTFHVMRDHPAHCTTFVLGGAWGAKINQQRYAISTAAEKMFHENHLHQYNYDQDLLIKHYKSIIAESMIAHDSYCCQLIGFPSQPYPTPRTNGFFVGWREIEQTKEALEDYCPEQCRPKNLMGSLETADWNFC